MTRGLGIAGVVHRLSQRLDHFVAMHITCMSSFMISYDALEGCEMQSKTRLYPDPCLFLSVPSADLLG